MVDLARPMLAEVLATLTGVGGWDRCGSVCVEPESATRDYGGSIVRFLWTVTDPADAQETLVARGLLPEGWCGDVRRGWWCSACGGTGNGKSLVYGTAPCEACCPDLDRPWERRGWTSAPRTIPDLVAVASLGVPALLHAETLARESAAFDRPRSAPHLVVWRVGERETTFITPDGCTHEQAVEAARRRDALVRMGLAIDAIDRDAVRIVVPPVGGGRG